MAFMLSCSALSIEIFAVEKVSPVVPTASSTFSATVTAPVRVFAVLFVVLPVILTLPVPEIAFAIVPPVTS